MAWTSTDLATIETAITANAAVSKVRFADGREVTYRTVEEMARARDLIRQSIAATAGRTMSTYASFTRD